MIKFAYRKRIAYTRKSIILINNRENRDIINYSIVKEEVVNELIPKAQYESIYTHRYDCFGSSK